LGLSTIAARGQVEIASETEYAGGVGEGVDSASQGETKSVLTRDEIIRGRMEGVGDNEVAKGFDPLLVFRAFHCSGFSSERAYHQLLSSNLTRLLFRGLSHPFPWGHCHRVSFKPSCS
jgi:hypothetical protein